MNNRERAREYKEAHPDATNVEISEAIGVPRTTVWKALNSERVRRVSAEYRNNNRADRRRWDKEQRERNRLTCPECGGLCGMGSAYKAGKPRTCEACVRRRAQERREKIAELWLAGESLKSIAAAVDSTENAVGADMARWRSEGHDFPYRRPEMRVR